MELKLKKKPKNPLIIEGFPGLGMVGTIATEFLINHLKTELIGVVKAKELPPMIGVHNKKVIQPISIHYNEQHNIVIVNAMTHLQGLEWQLAEVMVKLSKQLDASSILSLESVGSATPTENNEVYHYSNNTKNGSKFKKLGIKPLKEGIIIGVSGALMLEEGLDFSAIFAETHSNLPDSKAAAEIVRVVNSYLGLKIDPEPLLKSAEVFEQRLKDLMSKTKQAGQQKDRKQLSYLG